jgi:short-subunit dehydrogenase
MTRTRLPGSVCLVTGATSGIGRAAVAALGREGAHVIATGRDEESLRQLAGTAGVSTIAADLESPGAAHRLAADALALRGRVDVLVNNAGRGTYATLVSLDEATVEGLIAVNLTAPIELTRALLPGMLERRTGHIVNVGSLVGHVGRRLETDYAATKAGITRFTESLRAELDGTGVGVSLISPGVIDTEFFARRGVPYDRRWPRPVPAERVGATIVEAIRDDRAEIIVPGWLVLPVRLRGTVPALYRTLSSRFD